jgi:hypothetical protein
VRRTDPSSREVLPTVARPVCGLENLMNEEAIARIGLQRHVKKSNTFTHLITHNYQQSFNCILITCNAVWDPIMRKIINL